MERQIATVGLDGQLELPADVQSALGLHPGSRLEVSVKDRQIVLQPILPDRIGAVRGMFGSGPSLEDDLMEWRRSEKW